MYGVAHLTTLAVAIGLLALTAVAGCWKPASEESCRKMTRHKVAVIFRNSQLSRSTRERSVRQELKHSLEECTASWTEKEVACVLAAQDKKTIRACRH